MSKDQKLAEQDQCLRIAKSQKNEIAQSLSTLKQSIGSSENEIEQLLKQKSKLESKLERKDMELSIVEELNVHQEQLLHSLHKKISLKEADILDLRKEVEEEIAGVKQELEEVKTKLEKAEAKVFEYERELHKLTSELKQKSEEVEVLLKKNAQTKLELDLEREKVHQLRMQETAAQESEDTYRKETKVRMLI